MFEALNIELDDCARVISDHVVQRHHRHIFLPWLVQLVSLNEARCKPEADWRRARRILRMVDYPCASLTAHCAVQYGQATIRHACLVPLLQHLDGAASSFNRKYTKTEAQRDGSIPHVNTGPTIDKPAVSTCNFQGAEKLFQSVAWLVSVTFRWRAKWAHVSERQIRHGFAGRCATGHHCMCNDACDRDT